MTSRNSAMRVRDVFLFRRHGNSSFTASQDGLQLRSARHAFTTNRAAASGASQPDGRNELLVTDRTRRPLHQLAAGSVRELSGAPGFSEADAAILSRNQPGSGNDGHQSVRFLSRTLRRKISIPL